MKFFLPALLIFFFTQLSAQENWTSTCAGALPVVKEIMIHPCGNASASEYEILNTGSNPLKLSDFKITSSVLNGASIGSAVFNPGDNNTAAIAQLNAAVSTCAYSHTFVDVQLTPYWGTVPANVTLIIFNNKDNIDLSYLSANVLSSMCGSKIFVAFATTTSTRSDKTIFPDMSGGGGCGTSCFAQIDFQFNGSTNCTKIIYDISKVSNAQGSSLIQNGNGITYKSKGVVTNPQAQDCLPPQNLTNTPCTSIAPTHSDITLNTLSGFFQKLSLATQIPLSYLTLPEPYNVHWTGPTNVSDNVVLTGLPALSAGKYTVTLKDSKGCESKVNIFVLPPNGFVISLSGDTIVCPNVPTQIKADIIGGKPPYIYSWATKSGSAIAGNVQSTFLTQDTTTDYVLTVKDANNVIQTQNFTINTLPKPNVKITLLPDSIVCNEVVVTIIGSGAKSYAWSSQPSIASSALSSTIGDTVKLYTVFLPAFGYDIICTATDANGCVNTAKRSLVVHPLPKVTINPIPDSICVSAAPIKLSGYPDVGGTYFGTCGICVQGDYFYPQFASLDPQKPNTISHKVKDSYGCENAPSIVINVKDCTCLTPVTVFAGNDLSICENSIVILHGKYTNATSATWTTNGTGQFGDIQAPTTTYSPSFADFTKGSVVIKFAADAPITPTCNIRADSFTLTLAKKSVSNFYQNICKGDSFRIKTIWYKQSGNYSDTLTNIYGCDSIVNVNLSVNKTDSTFFFLTTCNASEVGVKYTTLKNSKNCDSVIVMNMRFTPATTSTISKSICAGDSLLFQNKYLNLPGTYTFKTLNVNSCDSTITLNLSLNAVNKILKTATTCNSNKAGTSQEIFKNVFGCDSTVITTTTFVPLDTFKISGATCDLPSAGTFVKKYTGSGGCDSVVSTILKYAKFSETNLTKSICKGDSVFFNNLWLKGTDTSQFGLSTYAEKTIAVNGCDSIITLYLKVNKPDTIQKNFTSCNTQKIGTTRQVFRNKFGCDSTIITTTSLTPLDTFKISGTTCDAAKAGLSVQKYKSIAGCDSIVATTLTYSKSAQTNFDKSICKGDSVFFNNLWVKTTNSYVLKTIAISGCDSIVIMNLVVNNPDLIQKNLTTCDANKVGTSKQILKNRFGCDSTIISTTTLISPDTLKLTVSTCDSTKTGIIFKKYTNLAGCDSTVATTFTFTKIPQTSFSKTICNGDSVLFNNSWVKTANTYSLKTIAINGCDSIAVMNLTVNKTDTVQKNFATCNPNKIGTTQQVFKNTLGCDSIIVSTTTLIPLDTFKITGTTCDPAKAGISVKKYTNVAGCDSVVGTTLTFAQTAQTNFDKTICNGDSILFNNAWIKTMNVYTLKTISVTGCDSVVTMNLRVNKKDTTYINGLTCDSAKAGTLKKLLRNSGGCDSSVVTTNIFTKPDTIFLKLNSCNVQDTGMSVKRISVGSDCEKIIMTQVNFAAIPINLSSQTICPGDSVLFSNAWVKTADTYQKIYKTLKGCDSTVVLNLSVTNKIVTKIDTFTCDAAQVGTKTLNLKSKSGCDSTVMINTSLGASGSILKDSVSCNVRDTGVFISTISQIGGCNKTLTTHIQLGKIDFQSRNATLCAGDSAQMGVQWFKVKGIYSKVFKNTQGCDSTVMLTLNVLQRDTVLINKISCNARDTGTLQQNLKKLNGCDSTVITKTQLTPSTLRTNLAQLKPATCYNYNDGAVYLKNIEGGTPSYKYQWTNGFTTDTLRNLKSGWYQFSASDANNCTIIDSVFVAQPSPIRISVAAQSPNCYGQTDGSIRLDTIAGGTSPYNLFLDGKNIDPPCKDATHCISTNRVAGVGTHTIKINDANNCIFDTTLTVKEAPKREISLGSDLKIRLGDSILIGSFLNFTPKTIKWTPPEGLSCDNCLPVFARPINTTDYKLVVTDSLGCVVFDKFTINVSKLRHVYIPTAFSPDGNGTNDKFLLYADNSVEKILRMQIYNRWGALVFSKTDCLPNLESEGWNGTFNSNQVITDTYIYFFEVLFKDGNVEIYSGDVSLVR